MDVTEVKQIYFDTSNSGNSTVGKAVDLGLPSGTKWADRNVGASSPEDFGDYYAWGETEVKDSYTWETYTLCDGKASSCYDIGEDIAGTDYDVAHVKWGGNWEMPTKEQFEELINNCTWYYTVRIDDEGYGRFGYRVIGTNGKSIFLPIAGAYEIKLGDAGNEGDYWSSTIGDDDISPDYTNCAYKLFINGVCLQISLGSRYDGNSVRPVSE